MHRTSRKHFLVAGVLVLVFTWILQRILDLSLPLPESQASSQATLIDNLIGTHIWLIAAAGALVLVIMCYAMVVFRARPGEEELEGDHFHGNYALEVVWTVAPLVVVGYFAVLGTQVLAEVTAEQPDEMTVEVTGLQWAWRFAYPSEGEFQSTQMVVPVNQPLLLSMEAEDVLHSFWVVEWRVKEDLVPGIKTELRVTPTEVGEFKLRCAELCGLRHAYMLADVKVVTREEYDAWVDEELE